MTPQGGKATGIGTSPCKIKSFLSRGNNLILINNTKGRHHRLSLIMTSFQPQVRCTHPITYAPAHCDEILASMPAFKKLQIFGSIGTRYVEIGLPYELANCKLRIPGPSISFSTFKIPPCERVVDMKGLTPYTRHRRSQLHCYNPSHTRSQQRDELVSYLGRTSRRRGHVLQTRDGRAGICAW